ncbi:PHD finger protein At1g33420-like [Punica granatum]|uniref:PHD finger protein At1g33420-like n=1 Tax=Punica granatum TaxID=22663 RepID=A0A6P8E6M1_PUNGR|nr:PHD finger protein At1g33420-like [Punica granatum]
MVVSGRPLKRMKRRVTADLHNFFTFPEAAAPPTSYPLFPFRANVREFLSKHALLPPPSSLFPHLIAWQVLFRAGDLPDSVVCLDVIEEDVARSRSVYCDQCRVVGWSDHPVCGKRYHFIIKADGIGIPNGNGNGFDIGIGGYHKPCICCGDMLHLSDSRCKSCNHVMTEDDVEEWIYHQLEDTANTHHLLHGVVHANGFGHLLRVNGREGGSRTLSGCHIMDFWDRLCKTLGVRKVSVMDVSRKFGLEYRLVHAIIKGCPWYGNWGYEFGAGSFGASANSYAVAVDTLSSLSLSTFMNSGQKRLQDTIAFYQSLSMNHGRELVNIRDLFSFLMSLIQKARKFSSGATYGAACNMHDAAADSAVLHRWTQGDVKRVEEAMMKVLRAVSGSKWVSCRTLRAAVWDRGSPDLLELCLKELAGKSASVGMVVVSRANPSSGAPEYRLEPGSTAASSGSTTTCDGSQVSNCPSVDFLLWDLRYLYESILHPNAVHLNDGQHTSTNDVTAAAAAQRLLDCKKFIKDYEKKKFPSGATSVRFEIAVSCEVELADQAELANAMPPPLEIIILPPDATVSDLKLEASRTFQDVYLMFRRFQAEELIDYSGVDDSTLVKLLLPGGSAEPVVVRVRGRCIGKSGPGRYRMERGDENWTMDCRCGAKDDDGERMLACDACSVWQHTRCSGIPDSESVPVRFVCCRCRSSNSTQMKEQDKDVDEVKAAGCY